MFSFVFNSAWNLLRFLDFASFLPQFLKVLTFFFLNMYFFFLYNFLLPGMDYDNVGHKSIVQQIPDAFFLCF